MTGSTGLRSDTLSTKGEITGVLTRAGSTRVLAVAAVLLQTARVVFSGGLGRGDVVAVVATVAMTGTVEWIIHRFLLHAPVDSCTTRRLGTGLGHQQHHLDPPATGFPAQQACRHHASIVHYQQISWLAILLQIRKKLIFQ